MFTSRWGFESVVKISQNKSEQNKIKKEGKKKKKTEKHYTENLPVIQWAPVTHLSCF